MLNSDVFKNIKDFKEELNKISPTFCTAKWLQSTILLYNGETHSCHHVQRNKISVEQLKDNPKAIHNSPIKMLARRHLMEGKQSPECDYCWKIENLGTDRVSDRIYKSSAPWAAPYLQKVVESGDGADIDPTYLEVAFDSTCNFACMYCTPEVSSKWMEDAEINGPYRLHTISLHDTEYIRNVDKYPIRHNEYNPYIDAFWKWWPDLYPNLRTFRITGGEPLLSKHTWTVMEWIKNNPNPDIEFAINTNLGVPRKLIEKFVEEIRAIEGKVRRVKIFTSLEATGQHAEYIRHGLNYTEFLDNLNYIMTELPGIRVIFMTTVNALSIFTFKDFLAEIINLQMKYSRDSVGLSINYLRWPMCMDIRILDKKLMQPYLDEIVEYVENHRIKIPGSKNVKFYLEEIDQIMRLREYAMQPCDNRQDLIKDFILYFNQYDIRRKLDLHKTFPEVANMLVDE